MNELPRREGHSDHSGPRSRGLRNVLTSRWGLVGLGTLATLVVVVTLAQTSGVFTAVGSIDELTHTVKRGDLTISFTATGNIRATRSTPIFCELDGMSTIVSIVDEGSEVKQGDLLVELDSSELEQQYNQQKIQVETSYAGLIQAREELAIQKSQNQSDLEAAELDLELATLDLNKYMEGDWKLNLEKAKADIFIAREELERARNNYNWTRRLAEKGYVTKTSLIADELAMKKFHVQEQQALGSLEVLTEYTYKKDIRQFESAKSQAAAALERTKRRNAAILAKAEADLKAKEQTYELSKKRLDKITDQLEKTKIYAPQDGMVVYHSERWGRDDRMIEQGANVRQNQHLIDLPDVSSMSVSVQVHESQVDQLSVGTLAYVSVDALPQLALRGTVSKIGILPDSVNRWLNPDLKVYRTDVTLADSEELKQLKPGMSAKVEFIISRLENVVYVPVQSVTTIEGEHHCYLLERGEFVPHPVSLGLYNESFVHVTGGLEANDVIQLQAPAPKGAERRPSDTEDLPEVVADVPSADDESQGQDRSAAMRRGAAGGPTASPGGRPVRRGPDGPAGARTRGGDGSPDDGSRRRSGREASREGGSGPRPPGAGGRGERASRRRPGAS